MTIEDARHLWPVVEVATLEELTPMANVLEERLFDYSVPADLTSDASRRAFHDRILRAGGSSVSNLVRGTGPSWEAIVRSTAKQLDLPHKEEAVQTLERQVTGVALMKVLKGLPEGQRASLFETLESVLSPDDWRLFQGMIIFPEALDHDDLAIVVDAVLKLGPPNEKGAYSQSQRQLRRSLFTSEAKRQSIVLVLKFLASATNPVGWGISGALMALKIVGPAYRVMIPTVMWACLVRARAAIDVASIPNPSKE